MSPIRSARPQPVVVEPDMLSTGLSLYGIGHCGKVKRVAPVPR